MGSRGAGSDSISNSRPPVTGVASTSRTSTVRGAINATQLRNDGWHFMNLGYGLERADATARLLDVKYYVLLPTTDMVGGSVDTYQWTTLLREVSALTAYRWVYRESVRPWLVADLLVLNRQMPRSLASCQGMIVSYLERLATDYGRRGPAQRLASNRLSQFNEAKIEDIFQSGLHEYIQGFLTENNALAGAIHEQYLV